MPYEDNVRRATRELKAARRQIQDEISSYPAPIAGCDAQFTHLIGLRSAIVEALQALQAPRFVATPRQLEPDAGVESR